MNNNVLTSFFYERSNHLGNVQVVVSDKRISVCDEELEVDYFKAEVLSAMDYYPFGMMMPDRQWYANSDSSGYRFGFNGMERENQISGQGNNLDFGARIYDSRLGRWMSVDPMHRDFLSFSPYNFGLNSPICVIDPDGAKIIVVGGAGYRAHVLGQMIVPAMKSKTARQVIIDVIKSKNTLVIAANPDQAIGVYQYDAGSGPGQDGVMKARMTYNIEQAGEELDPANGANGKSLVNAPAITLIHEISHFHQFSTDGKKESRKIINPDNPVIRGEYDSDWDRYDYTANEFSAGEIYAVEIENKVRAEIGLPLRTHYAGVEIINKEISSEMKSFPGVDATSGTGFYLVDKVKPIDFKKVAQENTTISYGEAYEIVSPTRKTEHSSHGFGNSKVPVDKNDSSPASEHIE